MSKVHPKDPTIPTEKSGDYSPTWVSCPKNLSVFLPSEYPWPVSSAEQDYVSFKAKNSMQLWVDYLSRTNLASFNITDFLRSAESKGVQAGVTLPNVAFSISGGGNRALLYGASILDAFDSRNPQALTAGTGGILQLANYAAGLSASSWLLGGWASADHGRLSYLLESGWTSAFDRGYMDWKRFKSLPRHFFEVRRKKKAGFPVSIVEDDFNHGKSIDFSSVRNKPSYLKRSFPFPILVSTSRKAEGEPLNLESPTYEFTPEDFSVWHNSLNASIPLQYLGSKFSSYNGNAFKCAEGFDNIGSYHGLLNLLTLAFTKLLTSIWIDIVNLFVSGRMYEALVPNPFKGLGAGLVPGSGFVDSETDELLLADGAMAEESLPLYPLLKPSRNVDVIIAVDSTVNSRPSDVADVPGYPNGSSLHQTYARVQLPDYQGHKFPKIPDTNNPEGFVNLGYHQRATFFGCGEDVPLVVYLPNYFVTHTTNQSTMQAVYHESEIEGFLVNSFYIATQTSPTSKTNTTDWSVCLACALVDHQNTRNQVPRTNQCTECFKKYCAGGFKP
ncbi:lysophospholipase [Phakopsora pachyrhizi]|nr:lysophospholipase [Phakopsora pachyrhizi]